MEEEPRGTLHSSEQLPYVSTELPLDQSQNTGTAYNHLNITIDNQERSDISFIQGTGSSEHSHGSVCLLQLHESKGWELYK